MKNLKRITSLIMIALMICVLSISAFAHEIPDATRKGSITVTLKDGNTAVSGGTLTLYRVGEVISDNGNYTFELMDEYKASGVTFEDLVTEQAIRDLADYAKGHATDNRTATVDNNGKAVFSGLEIGLYLIVQEEPADGYLAINPFLVTVPMVEGGSYVYDVDASPKVLPPEKAPETTTQGEAEDTTVNVEESTSTKPEETTKPDSSTDETTKQPTKPSLPVTGQLNWPIPVLAVLGLVLIFIGYTLKYGKKGNQQT